MELPLNPSEVCIHIHPCDIDVGKMSGVIFQRVPVQLIRLPVVQKGCNLICEILGTCDLCNPFLSTLGCRRKGHAGSHVFLMATYCDLQASRHLFRRTQVTELFAILIINLNLGILICGLNVEPGGWIHHYHQVIIRIGGPVRWNAQIL